MSSWGGEERERGSVLRSLIKKKRGLRSSHSLRPNHPPKRKAPLPQRVQQIKRASSHCSHLESIHGPPPRDIRPILCFPTPPHISPRSAARSVLRLCEQAGNHALSLFDDGADVRVVASGLHLLELSLSLLVALQVCLAGSTFGRLTGFVPFDAFVHCLCVRVWRASSRGSEGPRGRARGRRGRRRQSVRGWQR